MFWQKLCTLTFSGSCASTSFLSRRSKKGRSTLCKRRMIRMVSSSFRSTLKHERRTLIRKSPQLFPTIPTRLWTHLLSSHGKRGVEPLFEGAAALEDRGQEEIEQGPELGELVLQRSSCEQQTSWRQVVCVQDLGQLTVMVLHTMAFIHNHVLPADLCEEDMAFIQRAFDYHLKGKL